MYWCNVCWRGPLQFPLKHKYSDTGCSLCRGKPLTQERWSKILNREATP